MQEINQIDVKGKQGYWETRTKDGTLRLKGSYIDNDRDGLWEHYNQNGSLAWRGAYNRSEKIGFWEYHSTEGTFLILTEYYVRD